MIYLLSRTIIDVNGRSKIERTDLELDIEVWVLYFHNLHSKFEHVISQYCRCIIEIDGLIVKGSKREWHLMVAGMNKNPNESQLASILITQFPSLFQGVKLETNPTTGLLRICQ